MIRKAAWILLGVAVLAALAPSQNFSKRNVGIRAGVVLLDSQQIAGFPYHDNFAPYVWLNLDSNRNVKPAGWSFYNPSAPTRVTQAIRDRWIQVNNAHGYGAVGPAVGDLVTKRDAAYWELVLSAASDAQMTSYDVLHISAYGAVQLNPLEQQKLRVFMEGGGVLWVDVFSGYGPNLDLVNGMPIGFTVGTTNIGGPASADFLHPLLTVPNTLGFDSLFAMQSEAVYGLRNIDFAALGFPDLVTIQSTTQGDSFKLLPIASDIKGPVIALAQVGDGFLVVTCRGVARTLNQAIVGNPPAYNNNNGHRAYNPTFDRTSDAAAKLVANMANLGSGHSQMSKGSRKSNSTPIDITAPLLKRFDQDLNISMEETDYYPPVLFQGLAIITVGDQLVAYDANPTKDLDGDGNPDDGVVDFALGYSHDVVWTSQTLGEILSAPACAEISTAPAGLRQQIAVVGESGTLYIFDAFPAAPSLNVAPAAAVAPPPGTSATTATIAGNNRGRGPYAPTYHDGLIFITDEASAGLAGIVGRAWVADASNPNNPLPGAARWQAGGSNSPSIQRPSGSAVVGYIPIADNSGGFDRVLYIPTRANPGTRANAGVTSIWLGAKGEKPTSAQVVGNQLIVNTRAVTQGLDVANPGAGHPLGIRLSIIDANGRPLDHNLLNNRINGAAGVNVSGGVLTFTFRLGQTLLANETVRVDYTIDWGTGDPNKTSQLLRGQVFLPDDINQSRRILHNLALSPQGTLHMVHSAQGDSTLPISSRDFGSFYSFREEGRGAFKLLNRYDLYPQHTFTLNQATPVTLPTTLTDGDGVQQFAPPFIGGAFTRLTFVGGPSVLNDVVYVTALGYKAGGLVPCTIVMAFKADPELPRINVGDISGGFTILQPDIARSINKVSPELFSTLQGGQYVYERQPALDKGTITIDNLMSTNRGPVQNAISLSQPIIIRRSGQPDMVIEPDRTGSRWNPLLWYAVFHGVQGSSPPTVTGKTLFFAGQSALPDLLAGNFPPTQTTGILTGLEADISPNDPFLLGDANPAYPRPWNKQLIQVKFTSLVNIEPNPAIKWPQTTGVNSFQGWAIRLLQTTLPGKSNALGVVAGDGALLSWAPSVGRNPGGLFAYSRADFVVADEGRLARFDPAGNPIWATDAALSTGTSLDVGGAAEVKPMVRPTKAYPIGNSDLLVVDTGGDRVVRLDASGRELRSIDKFQLWPDTGGANPLTPDGFKANDPLTLKGPRDVVYFADFVAAGSNPFANASPLELWFHYVIADGGNKRIVEVVDRYVADPATRRNLGAVVDANGKAALGALYWHSPSSFSGKNFNYTSLGRVFVPDLLNPANNRWVYAAGIGSALPTRVDTGLDTPTGLLPRESEGGNGGIVIFDGANSQVINEVTVPAIANNVFYNPATGNFDAPGRSLTQKLLRNLNSVSLKNIVHPALGNRVAIMFTDAEGVFEIVQQGAGGPWTVVWMLPREAYRVMRHQFGTNNISNLNPADFRPYYARRLDSGEVLIVNGYYGIYRKLNPGDPDVPFNGEVIQVDGDPETTDPQFGFSFNKQNLGFWTFSIRFELPPITGTRGLIIPVFADRR